ncbi:MAG: 16S rRNA (guanine(966)-N(2))-methyltransferase RsmD [Peptococcaceae bacterium]|nr:16S rRNA (guanine(966)-N(2))-methyltransferase RsmD [Peptococcaceae bacterium]
MRIIAGSAKGRRIECLKGLETRPTRDRVREAVFSSLGGQTEGVRGLDLFAGAGAMGIEALSRGAAEVVFVERNPEAAALIRSNLRHCRLEKMGQVRAADVFRYLEGFRQSGQKGFDLIFCDPPYGREDYGTLMALAGRGNLLNPGGIFVLEGLKSLEPDGYGEGLTLFKTRSYGKTGIFYFKKGP